MQVLRADNQPQLSDLEKVSNKATAAHVKTLINLKLSRQMNKCTKTAFQVKKGIISGKCGCLPIKNVI